jgi:hypothetical protein
MYKAYWLFLLLVGIGMVLYSFMLGIESVFSYLKLKKEKTIKEEEIIEPIESKEELGDTLCDYCPLESYARGVQGVGGKTGYISCEGMYCDEAYENYLEEMEE